MKNNDKMKHIYPLAIILFALVIAGCNQNESATEEVCDNTCPYAFDGDCDDGGPNSDNLDGNARIDLLNDGTGNFVRVF